MGISENLWEKETGAEHARQQKNSSKHDLPTTLYLFGRTGREKEEWFRHFLFAAMDTEMEKSHSLSCLSGSGMKNL